MTIVKRRPFARRVQKIKQISLIRQMSMDAEEILDRVIHLGQGIPPFELPVKFELSDAILNVEDINKYTLEIGLPDLREAIANKLHVLTGVGVNPETEVYVSGGAAAGLFNAAMAIVDRGDWVVMLAPTYSPFIQDTILAEGKPKFVPLKEEEGWKPDIDGLEKIVRENYEKVKAIILCNPNNPTGTVYDKEDLERIAKIVIEHGLFLIVDETYGFLTYNGKKHVSLASLIPSMPELKNNLVTIISFSKEYAMPGLRVGYTYAQEDIVKELLKVHDAAMICAPAPSQFAALYALRGPQDIVDHYREEYARARELICRRLDSLSDIFRYQKPMGAYYVEPRINPQTKSKVPYKNSQEFSKLLLFNAGVVSVAGLEFNPEEKENDEHVRFSIAVPLSAINEGFDRLEGYIRHGKRYVFNVKS